jgi:hypothetical protein
MLHWQNGKLILDTRFSILDLKNHISNFENFKNERNRLYLFD